MKRRDTIIIAILVNAGLLMVLFATAMRSDNKLKQATPGEIARLELAKLELKEAKNSGIQDFLNEPLNSSIKESPENVVHLEPQNDAIFGSDFDGEDLVVSSVFENTAKIEPVPVAPSQEPEKIDFKKHASVTVKKGDVLEKIARSHGTTVAALMEINHLNSTQLKIGQVLQVPDTQKAAPASSSQKSPSTNQAEEYYIVKEGDNPWMIATKNKVKWEDVLRLNNLDEQKARRLRPGDKLRLR